MAVLLRNYILAIGYKIFGFHDSVHRLVMMRFSFVAILEANGQPGATAMSRGGSGASV